MFDLFAEDEGHTSISFAEAAKTNPATYLSMNPIHCHDLSGWKLRHVVRGIGWIPPKKSRGCPMFLQNQTRQWKIFWMMELYATMIFGTAFECFYDSSKFSKSWFYQIISSRHKPIKKHLGVLQVPFCHYRTIVLWQLSQVVSHCIPIFPYIFRVTLGVIWLLSIHGHVLYVSSCTLVVELRPKTASWPGISQFRSAQVCVQSISWSTIPRRLVDTPDRGGETASETAKRLRGSDWVRYFGDSAESKGVAGFVFTIDR